MWGNDSRFFYPNSVTPKGISCAGLMIVRSTLAQRVGQTGVQLQPLVDALREARIGEPVPVIGQWLSRLFKNYCNYYHVPGNTRRLDAFRREVIDAWRHALKRRSQRHRMNDCAGPTVHTRSTRVTNASLSHSLFRRQTPRQEPYKVILHIRIYWYGRPPQTSDLNVP